MQNVNFEFYDPGLDREFVTLRDNVFLLASHYYAKFTLERPDQEL